MALCEAHETGFYSCCVGASAATVNACIYSMYTTHSDAEYKTHTRMQNPFLTPNMIQTVSLLTCTSGPLMPLTFEGRIQGWDDPRWWTSFRDLALFRGSTNFMGTVSKTPGKTATDCWRLWEILVP